MNDAVIRVESLSKAYQIGLKERHGRSFREAVIETLGTPLRRMRSLAGGGSGEGTEETFWALKDVSFEVQRGEVLGIIGRNGAGKSTLLKILSRITEPTSGRVRLRGRVASLLEVGTGFHPELTGRENIYLNGAVLGMKRAEITRKFDEMVAFAEVEKFLDTPVKRYSSGMYVRLAFAVAAHLEPEILIVDEVLAVGDAEFQKKCLGKMQDVAQGQGRTVLFVSHNMAAVRSLCSTACVLAGGRMVERGDSEACVRRFMAGDQVELPARVRLTCAPGAGQWMDEARLVVNGQLSSEVHMGDSLAVEVDFCASHPIDKPRLGITLYAADGSCLIHTGNRFQPGGSYATPVVRGTIAGEVGKLPLVAGRYSISLWFGDTGADTHVAHQALAFNLIGKDIWGTGRIPPANASYFWWPAEFRLR